MAAESTVLDDGVTVHDCGNGIIVEVNGVIHEFPANVSLASILIVYIKMYVTLYAYVLCIINVTTLPAPYSLYFYIPSLQPVQCTYEALGKAK